MNKNTLSLALVLAGLAVAGTSQAVDLSVVPGTSNPPSAGGNITGVVVNAANTGNDRGWNLTLQLPVGVTAANVVANTTTLGPLGSCTYSAGNNRLILLAGNITDTAVPAGTACTFDFVFAAGADGTQLVVEELAAPGCTATTVAGTCTAAVVDALPGMDPGNPGVPEAHVATLTAAPVPRTLSYNPAAGSTINFTAGATPGTAAPAQLIDVTSSGTTGNATLSGCVLGGTNPGSFSVTPTSLSFTTSTTQQLSLGCTYPTSDATATLTCSETDADSTNASRTWNLACPAPNTNPTITSTPAAPATITTGGARVGQLGLSQIAFTATGGSGTGSTSINCTSTGTVLISLSPATPAGTAANQTVTGAGTAQSVRIGVPLTNAAQSPAGTVSCSFGGGPAQDFTINAPAGTVVVPPEFIPASSFWSQLSLIGLLAALGGLFVAFRRNA